MSFLNNLYPLFLKNFAGLPIQISLSGTDLVTTEPNPIKELLPILTASLIETEGEIHVLSPIVVLPPTIDKAIILQFSPI